MATSIKAMLSKLPASRPRQSGVSEAEAETETEAETEAEGEAGAGALKA